MTSQAERYLGLLSRGPGAGALESAGGGGGSAAARQVLLDRLQAEIRYVQDKTGITIAADDVGELVGQAQAGLSKLFGDGPSAQLNTAEVSGLEAVIRTDGSRPVLFVEDDFIDVTAPSAGDYAATLSRLEDGVRQVCRSVGRVDDPTSWAYPLGYQGTAWMLAEGLVATNYHVLQAIAPGGVRRGDRFEGRLNTGVAVNFGHEVGKPSADRRFPIRRVVSVGRAGAGEYLQATSPGLNFDDLDLAILQLEPVPGRRFPEPNLIARGDDPNTRGGLASTGRSVYLVGYPGGEQSRPDLFAKIFAGVKSFKRLGPGRITAAAGEVPNDPRGWIITHDASTLGGNSGSALADLESDGRTLLGLHFAGLHEQRNWAHGLERITAELAPALPPAGP
jgi:Trypsin-like peptidase domain